MSQENINSNLLLEEDQNQNPPSLPHSQFGGSGRRRRKKSRSASGKQTVTIGLPMFGSNSNGTAPMAANGAAGRPSQQDAIRRSDAQNVPSPGGANRNRTNSVSSNTSGSSGGISFPSSSPPNHPRGFGGVGGQHESSIADRAAAGLDPVGGGGAGPPSLPPNPPPGLQHPASALAGFTASGGGPAPPRAKHLSGLDDRARHDSGGSIFLRRPDYSAFNVLPRHKINSYHIKMEDECSIGNDETRIFILSSFASKKMNRVPCVTCNALMLIYDRYPLVDGTFFLSPRQYNKSCVQVKYEGKVHYLTAVCMGCLEAWPGHAVLCRSCLKPWAGGHLILGTMYSYDIFAAMPCCAERLKCNNCAQLVIHPEQRFNFFSDYSQMVSCPACGVQDAHFCKNISVYLRGQEAEQVKLSTQQHQQQQQQHQHAAMIAAGMRVQRVNSA